MKIYLNCTANLGDFLNAMPVLSGVSKKYGKFDFIIKGEMKKFKGLRQFLQYQDLFTSVEFDQDIFLYGDTVILSSWTREDKNDPNRPIETCRYENWLKDNYKMDFEVDDDFEIKFPDLNIPVNHETSYIGDRWSVGNIDDRRETHILAHLKGEFVDFNNDMLTNAYIIKNSTKPFISNFTGVGIMADLLNKETYVVWKAEDWKPEFRVGDDINWDNGKNIDKVFEKHFYLNRKSKLIHASNLENIL